MEIVLHSWDVLEPVLFRITSTRTFVLTSGSVEVIREGCADVLRIDIGILGRRGHRIVARPTVAEIAEDIVGKEGGGQVAVKECLLHTGIDIELVGIVTEAVVVTCGVMKVKHSLRCRRRCCKRRGRKRRGRASR